MVLLKFLKAKERNWRLLPISKAGNDYKVDKHYLVLSVSAFSSHIYQDPEETKTCYFILQQVTTLFLIFCFILWREEELSDNFSFGGFFWYVHILPFQSSPQGSTLKPWNYLTYFFPLVTPLHPCLRVAQFHLPSAAWFCPWYKILRNVVIHLLWLWILLLSCFAYLWLSS